ncbi:hypothetical protein CS5676_0051 [Clostridium phage phiCs5676-1]|nr:hypothetical protein CS5676_0051 [Clostridium phage phiCs5676-1]
MCQGDLSPHRYLTQLKYIICGARSQEKRGLFARFQT